MLFVLLIDLLLLVFDLRNVYLGSVGCFAFVELAWWCRGYVRSFTVLMLVSDSWGFVG